MTNTSKSRPTASDRFWAAGAESFQQRLAQLNHGRLVARHTDADWEADLDAEMEIRRMEGLYVERERQQIAPLIADVPSDPDEFMQWFENLKHAGPGQGDPLFPWLAESASMEQMRWFLTQEVAGEAGFDDLVALTQLRLPNQAKLELARNYWDEMGRGREEAMHGLLLDQTVRELKLNPSINDTVSEALALGNMMLALASSRRYAYQSIGALGVVELTAPGRVSRVCDGLKRLGVSEAGRRYFQLHAGLDVRHSEAWNREAIRPLVEADPGCAKYIAEGALLRLRCGERCFIRYRSELFHDLSLRDAA
jgi:hypothetical protein